MAYLSLDYGYFTNVNRMLANFSKNTPSLSLHATLGGNLKSCARCVAVRIAAIASLIVGGGMIVCGITPVEMLLLASRITRERSGPLGPIIRTEWSFMKTVLIGLGGCFGSIFCPSVVYDRLKVNEALNTSIANTLSEIPENIQAISRSFGRDIAISNIANWRQELADALARGLPAAPQRVRDENFTNFNFQFYKDALRRTLLTHFSMDEVATAFGEAPSIAPQNPQNIAKVPPQNNNPIQEQDYGPRILVLKNGVQDVHLSIPFAKSATLEQKIHALFYECLKEVKEGLLRVQIKDGHSRVHIYTQDDLNAPEEGAYDAVLDLATLNFLLKWWPVGNSCQVRIEGQLVQLDGRNNAWGLYERIMDFVPKFYDLEDRELVEPLLYHKTDIQVSSLDNGDLSNICNQIGRLRLSFAEARLKDLSPAAKHHRIGNLIGF
jgi:hypothetical protein